MARFDHFLWQSSLIAQVVSYLVGAFAAGFAARAYWRNSKTQRATWLVQLYEKFFESGHYKAMRELLDCDPNADEVNAAVAGEKSDFTDYLNFFEMVTALADSGEISDKEVLTLFEYYLGCLKAHDAVMRYVEKQKNGYEKLRSFMKNKVKEKTK